MIGLKRGTVELHAHDSTWDRIAADTVQTLKNILGDVARDIRHVGSTSISSIKAKPIIDIAIAVDHLEDIVPMVPLMEAGGFRRKNIGTEDEVFFSAGDFERDIRTHHIHVVEYEGMAWRNYVNFTAYLNTHPTVARQYETLKESLLAQFAENRTAYTDGKADWIQYTLRKAMVWSFLGKTVTIGIDRPIGYAHKKDIVYPINYGYIPGVLGGDGEELDVYLLGVNEPVERFEARIIAIVHRENDVEDKLVAAPVDMDFTRAEITQMVHFQEKYYDSHIELLCNGYTIREYREYLEDEILALYHSAGQTNDTECPEMLAQSFQRSLLTLGAYIHDRLVGLIRTVGDGCSSVLIQDLLVLPEYRHRGIGSALLREVQMQYCGENRIQLLAYSHPALTDFYRKNGFEEAENCQMCAMIAVTRPPYKQEPKIHPISEKELDTCVDLIRQSFLTVADEFGFTQDNAPRFTAFAISKTRLLTQFMEKRPMFICTDEEGNAIGYYSLCHKDEQTVELNNLCVDPEYRHKKYGEKLLLHAVREGMVRGYRHMVIGIVEENQRLRRWYEKYGFVHTGTQKFDFFPFTCGYLTKNLYGEDG